MNQDSSKSHHSNDLSVKNYSSYQERILREEFASHFRSCPIPDDQILSNLGLFLNSKSLARLLFMDHIYRQIVDVMGVVMEFGTRWGPNLAQFSALRGIYEPFNRHRKIIGFDTFTGFLKIDAQDGHSDMMRVGHLRVSENYQTYLEHIMRLQEQDNPLGHIRKFEIIGGDATKTLPEYLDKHRETIIALAYFDLDVYAPTKACLEAIKPRLVKGSVLGFDELNDPDSPGETEALLEVFGLNNVRLKRYPYASRTSYFVVE
ncbi:MAG: crotonobetainyl-CoA--carnitine CoA-transferase [Candidatus Sericytochromatia bacterium]|nr:crotonobetainyl-CoA--carnitine CoA-transferase [Candidatus Sericytochromatia bacterium]